MEQVTIEDLYAEKAELEAKVKKVQEAINAFLSKTLVRCEACRLGFEIGELSYIQTHWYTQPSGCSDGDYWNEGEGVWQCTCGRRNRLYNKPDIMKLKRRFKDVVEEHKQ